MEDTENLQIFQTEIGKTWPRRTVETKYSIVIAVKINMPHSPSCFVCDFNF